MRYDPRRPHRHIVDRGIGILALLAVRVSGVDPKVTALERAFVLAKSGNVATIDALRRQLKDEGYLDFTVTGKALTKQLRALINT